MNLQTTNCCNSDSPSFSHGGLSVTSLPFPKHIWLPQESWQRYKTVIPFSLLTSPTHLHYAGRPAVGKSPPPDHNPTGLLLEAMGAERLPLCVRNWFPTSSTTSHNANQLTLQSSPHSVSSIVSSILPSPPPPPPHRVAVVTVPSMSNGANSLIRLGDYVLTTRHVTPT